MDSALAPPPAIELAAPDDAGTLGIFHLKRYWSRTMLTRQGRSGPPSIRERHLDYLVVHATGLGLEQTTRYLGHEGPSFEEFERWIMATTGGVDATRVARINAAVAGTDYPDEIKREIAAVEASAPVLSDDHLAFWNEHGYVVLLDAVPAECCDAAARALWEHLDASPDDPESWYRRRNQGIMVQYFQHPAFEANRRAPRIRKAFAQLWGTADLWVTTDRVGFNVPERPGWQFPGPTCIGTSA